MQTVGVICEYNPFHLGHARQFAAIRRQLGQDAAIVCLMSGNYVQRGEPAVFDKLTRARAAADAGADLIIGGHTHTLQPVELLTASDGRDVPVYYSLGNFLSHQKEKMNLLGGMASVTIVKDADGTHVSEYDLKPTINVILRNENTGWYTYRPMLLDSYGTELAAQNRFSECTVDAMWALYEDITG